MQKSPRQRKLKPQPHFVAYKSSSPSLASPLSKSFRCCPPKAKSKARPSTDRKSTRLNSSHQIISYAVFCLKKKQRVDGDRTLQHDAGVGQRTKDVLLAVEAIDHAAKGLRSEETYVRHREA